MKSEKMFHGVHQWFETQANHSPNACAMIYGDEHVSYEQLNRRANKLARKLEPIALEQPIAVCFYPSPDLLVSILGVLKAGGCYVPIDPAYPLDRKHYVLEHSGAQIMLTSENQNLQQPEIKTMSPPVDDCAEDDRNLDKSVFPEQLAYIIYTSGSTGRPKGVAVSHGSLMNLVIWHQETYETNSEDRGSLLAGPAFDASVWEIWPYLTIGACLAAPEPEVRLQPALLWDWLAETQITCCFAPTPLAEALMALEKQPPEKLKYLLTGGDKLQNRPRKGWPVALVNHYGPTENTVVSTHCIVSPDGAGLPTIGKPISNHQCHIVDGALSPVAQEEAGELVVAGKGLARGYFNDPSQTAMRFIPNPFGDHGSRLYRTGDEAVFRGDGQIHFLGRIDFQIKIRGFRVEPGEIENTLLEHEKVNAAQVLLVRDQLIAYIQGDTEHLGRFLEARLPEYMVPSIFVPITQFPITANGKIDRKALAETPLPTSSVSGEDSLAPRNPVEVGLAGIWTQLLNQPLTCVRDNFFALGGHSLLIAQLRDKVSDQFRVELPLDFFFGNPTLEKQAEGLIQALLSHASDSEKSFIVRQQDRTQFPLSYSQSSLWFIQSLDPQSGAYNTPIAWRIKGNLQPDAWRKALNQIMGRHEILHTTFPSFNGQPVQLVGEPAKAELEIREVEEDQVSQLLTDLSRVPFDLKKGPLARFTLLKTGEEEWVFLVCMHHMIVDGITVGIFMEELGQFYGAICEGRKPELPQPKLQFGDYAAWQRASLVDEDLLAWWVNKLANPPVLELPTDFKRPAEQSFNGDSYRFQIPDSLANQLKMLGQSENATPFVTLLSGFAITLYRYTYQKDIAIGVPMAERPHGTEHMMGFLINTLVFRLSLDGSVRDILGQTRDLSQETMLHRGLPFEKLVEAINPDRDTSRNALFGAMFSYFAKDAFKIQIPGVETEKIPVNRGYAHFDISLAVEEVSQGYSCIFEYSSDLFRRETIARMADHFTHILESMAGRPDEDYRELEMLDRAELARLNHVSEPIHFEAGDSVHQMFEAMVLKTPNETAVLLADEDGESLTFKQLNEKANALAHHLRSLGVGPEKTVAVCMERSPGLIVAIMGILKAGGAYAPLDASLPQARLDFMMKDTKALCVITQSSLAARFQDELCFCLDVWDEDGPTTNPSHCVHPDNAAYIIYTSGSTGMPKGTVLCHRTAINHAFAMKKAIYDPCGVPMRITLNAPLHFDGSVKQVVQLIFGRTLCIIPELARRDGHAFINALKRHAIQLMDCTPTFMGMLVESGFLETTDLALKAGLIGGESLGQTLWQKLAERQDLCFVNVYGPTECTVVTTCRQVSREELPNIGLPLPNSRTIILDPNGLPVPVGVIGELVISGRGLARNYLNQPGATAAKFTPDPNSLEPGSRRYRSGDLSRLLPNGLIECVGRMDHQVKIRGFRIELGEIESQLDRLDQVGRAVVLVREEMGSKWIIAFIQPAPEWDASCESQLEESLADTLPEYMRPQAYVFLEKLPQLPSGKVDRRALEKIGSVSRTRAGKELYKAPETPGEKTLAQIWMDLLLLERVGVHDNFFKLGGHSLLAVRVVAEVQEKMGVDLPLRTLFEKPTIAQLALFCDQSGSTEVSGVEVVDRDQYPDGFPLSSAQNGMWFMWKMNPGDPVYNIPFAYKMTGDLDLSALNRSLTLLAARHEVLRTVFIEKDGRPFQLVKDAENVEARCIHLNSSLDEAARATISKEALKPFDLCLGPLFRVCLFQLEKSEAVLLINLHHIIADGWSYKVLTRELWEAYNAFTTGMEPQWTPLSIQYLDYAIWKKNRLTSPVLERLLFYWRRQLDGAPDLLELPTDRPRSGHTGADGDYFPMRFSSDLSKSLLVLADEYEATPFMLLLAAYGVLLGKYSGARTVLIGVPTAGRNHPELHGQIGYYINTLVMRLDLEEKQLFPQLLGKVKATTLDAFDHQDLPLDKLVEVLEPERHDGANPLFQVMFGLQKADGEIPGPVGIELQPVDLEFQSARMDLSLALFQTEDGFHGGLEYKTGLFNQATIARMASHYTTLLESLCANSNGAIGEITMMDEAEKLLVLETWNQTQRSFPIDKLIHELVQETALSHPDLLAVNRDLTFHQLNNRANGLARKLQDLGVGPEVCVGVLMDHSPDSISACLGILKAGGCFVPMLPDTPHDRVAYILDDAHISILILGEEQSAAFQDFSGTLITPSQFCDSNESYPNPQSGAVLKNRAYIIYTSGSTGRPKGVVVNHENMLFVVFLYIRFFQVEPGMRGCILASPAFDACIGEIWPNLVVGVGLHIPEKETRYSAQALLAWFEENGITHGFVPRPLLEAIMKEPTPQGLVMKRLFTGGDKLSLRPPIGFPIEVNNQYGPTEGTVVATCIRVEPGEGAPSIGRPMENVTCYILDRFFRPTPLGVSGELVLGGPGLSRGYVGKPAMTAEVFTPNPFSSTPGDRLYRTGDLTRYEENGEIQFLGRIDFQVKIRGFRIELGEIENQLLRHPDVEGAVVLVYESAPGNKQLAAYVACGDQEPDPSDLEVFLAQQLPAYMIPASFVIMARFPSTSSGKIDRKALSSMPLSVSKPLAPTRETNPVEERLIAIWSEVLGRDGIGPDDHFFQLGGHSLLLTQAASRVDEQFLLDLPLRVYFQQPVLKDLARTIILALIESRHVGASDAPHLGRRAEDLISLPLSQAQRRLWIIHQLDPQSTAYHIPMAYVLKGEVHFEAMQQSMEYLVARHAALRTTFLATEGEPRQVIGDAVPQMNFFEDRRGEDFQTDDLLSHSIMDPFNLETGPLFRWVLIQVNDETHILAMNAHHIVFDGWSLNVFMRELGLCYRAFSTGGSPELSPLNIDYADYALWQQKWLNSKKLLALVDWWRQTLDGAPTLELPIDRSRPAELTFNGDQISFAIDSTLRDGVKKYALQEDVTPFVVLYSVSNLLLARYSGQQDIVTGTSAAGRNRRELESLIGFFVNTLAIRVDLSQSVTFHELTAQVKQCVLQAFDHQDAPFDKLVEALESDRDASRNPLFQVAFNLIELESDEDQIPGLRTEALRLNRRLSHFDLGLGFIPGAKGFTGYLTYNTALFQGATIQRMARHYINLLKHLLAKPTAPIASISLMEPEELQTLLVSWNRNRVEHPQYSGFAQCFEAQVKRTPQAIALVYRDQQMTYAKANEEANRLAAYLREQGVGPEVLVGNFQERSLPMMVAFLAILKAGGVYVPLDPELPEERLAMLVDSPSMKVVITESQFEAKLPEFHGRLVVTDYLAKTIETYPPDNLPSFASPENLAYVIYTSGSTGKPKGVGVTHGAALDHMLSAVPSYGLAPGVRVLQFAALSFDVSMEQIMATLICGASLVLRHDIWAPAHFSKILEDMEINVVSLPTAYWHLWAEEAVNQGSVPKSVTLVTAAGEAMLAKPLARWTKAFPHIPVINGYGPTETVVTPTIYQADVPFSAEARVPIGKVRPNRTSYVLDRLGNPVPFGVSGELHLGGLPVARGYLNRPSLTAAVFIPDPFSSQPGARLYKTGDLTRLLPDGNLEYLTRLDHQVKVRGFRIELGEIESALIQHPGVGETAVLARRGDDGSNRLDAFIAPTDPTLDRDALAGFLKSKLPEYMVPSVFIFMKSLPLTPSGKIDSKALPLPGRNELGETYQAPETPTQQAIATIWGEVLGLETIGIRDNFFRLGGHSLLAIQAVSRMESALKVQISLKDIFQNPTIAKLAAVLDEQASPQVQDIIAGQELSGPAPVSFAQKRLWFIDQFDPGSTAYNMPSGYQLKGQLNEAALESALNHLIQRHASLRTTFAASDGQPVQIIAEQGRLALRREDLRGHDQPETEASALFDQFSLEPFNLEAGPLMKCLLVRLADANYWLLVNMHHIITDGWSMGVFMRELGLCYQAYLQGQTPQLEPLPVSYAHYALWQQDQLDQERMAALISYWRSQLEDAPVLELPTDRFRPKVQTHSGGMIRFSIKPQLSNGVMAFSQQIGVTPFMVMLTAFNILLARYSGQDDIVVGTPEAGRNRKELEPLIGFFINTLALRLRLSGKPGFQALVDQVRSNLLEAYEHGDLPFDRLVEEVQTERDLSRNALFQAMFIYNKSQDAASTFSSISVSSLALNVNQAHFDLALSVTEGPDSMTGGLNYNTDLFNPDSIQRMAGHFCNLLENLISDPQASVWETRFLDAHEWRELMISWNQNREAHPQYSGFAQCFEAVVQETPDNLALVYRDQQMTYEKLNRAANKLAAFLRKQGVGPEVQVGNFQDRSLPMMVAFLAIMKAGGVYVPLDPELPLERLAMLVESPSMGVILTVSQYEANLPEFHGRVVVMEREAEAIEHCPSQNLPNLVCGDNLAYVIYTSGSTGKPKGVGVNHEAALDHMLSAAPSYGLDSGVRLLQFAALSFDVSMEQIMATLACGATLVLRHDIWAPADFSKALAEMKINVVSLPTAYWHLWADEAVNQGSIPEHVTLVTAAGEAMLAGPLARWTKAFPHVPVINGYGPTETVVTPTIYQAVVPFPANIRVPIGKARPNRTSYVLDRLGNPVPIGVFGELHMGGLPIARGYLERPSLTAAVFVPDPFSSQPGARLYKTGDLTRLLPDGNIEYISRLDHQVKVRGFRIELGEIESALLQHPGVGEVAVIARAGEDGANRLDAYIASSGETPDRDDLADFLKTRLPEYMTPSVFIFLEAMPKTPSGKIDTKALPKPGRDDLAETFQAPETPTQKAIAAIWQEVLRTEVIGVKDNFFRLGGHSLLATQAVSKLREKMKRDIALKALFENPTIEALARLLDAAEDYEDSEIPLTAIPRDGGLPLAATQKRTWFLSKIMPGSAFNIPNIWEARGSLNLKAFEQALAALMVKHESLRTRFQGFENPQVILDPPGQPPLIILEKSGSDIDETKQFIFAEAMKPFDLEKGPVWRVTVAVLGPDKYIISVVLHHIITDGWSMGVFMKDLASFYSLSLAGVELNPEPAPLQFVDFAHWQERWMAGEQALKQRDYWLEELAGDHPIMPTEKPRPAIPNDNALYYRFVFSKQTTERLHLFCEELGISLFMATITAYALMLRAWSRFDEIPIGTPIANRNRSETSEMIGFFVNTLVLMGDLRGDENGAASYRSLLQRFRNKAFNAFEHQDYPYDRLLLELNPKRQASYNPIFQVFFMFQNMRSGNVTLPGLNLNAIASGKGSLGFDLNLGLWENGEVEKQLVGGLAYKPHLFSKELVGRMAGYFQYILELMIRDPDAIPPNEPLPEKVPELLQEPVSGLERSDLTGSAANTRVYFKDRWLNDSPLGVPGELCIGGSSLPVGYQGDPARTAEYYVPDPNGAHGDRLLRTGDFGCFTTGGRIMLYKPGTTWADWLRERQTEQAGNSKAVVFPKVFDGRAAQVFSQSSV